MIVGMERMLAARCDSLLGLGVDLGVNDVGMLLRRGFERRCELAARAAPGGPEVHEDDVAAVDRFVEVLLGECLGGHRGPFHCAGCWCVQRPGTADSSLSRFQLAFSVAPKRPAVGLRRGATQTNEVLAKHGTAAESDAFCDDVDGEVGILEEVLGGQYSLIAEPAGGGCSRFRLETARERARGHVRAGCDHAHSEVEGEVLRHPVEERGKGCTRRRGEGSGNVLGLPTVTMGRHHHPSRDAIGNARDPVLFGRCAGTGRFLPRCLRW